MPWIWTTADCACCGLVQIENLSPFSHFSSVRYIRYGPTDYTRTCIHAYVAYLLVLHKRPAVSVSSVSSCFIYFHFSLPPCIGAFCRGGLVVYLSHISYPLMEPMSLGKTPPLSREGEGFCDTTRDLVAPPDGVRSLDAGTLCVRGDYIVDNAYQKDKRGRMSS